MKNAFLLVWMFLHLVEISMGGGTISIMLTKYDNSKGKGNNGKCCESLYTSNCKAQCDHYFITCLDQSGGPLNEVESCSLGRKQTGIIKQNVITFDESIGGTPNPMNFHFKNYLGSFIFKVQVWDHDSHNKHDFIDSFSGNITVNQSWKHIEALSQTRLEFSVSIVCDPNWCGPNCDRNRTDDTCDREESSESGEHDGNMNNKTDHLNETSNNRKHDENTSNGDDHHNQARNIKNGGKIAVLVLVPILAIIIIGTVAVFLWKSHQKKIKTIQEPPKHDDYSLNESDVTVYYEAQPYYSDAVNDRTAANGRRAGVDNDAFIYDDADQFMKQRAMKSVDSNTVSHTDVRVKSNLSNVETVEYVNAVFVKDTGDIYAEPDKKKY